MLLSLKIFFDILFRTSSCITELPACTILIASIILFGLVFLSKYPFAPKDIAFCIYSSSSNVVSIITFALLTFPISLVASTPFNTGILTSNKIISALFL